ncbi:unnamed protein product [Durusdinium trenchii]|uniref:Solute carrier family 40 protein n=1 Tax=Durusdinium trenchii TaxID=1381693 RepID=A0ABP0PCX0_9DINO
MASSYAAEALAWKALAFFCTALRLLVRMVASARPTWHEDPCAAHGRRKLRLEPACTASLPLSRRQSSDGLVDAKLAAFPKMGLVKVLLHVPGAAGDSLAIGVSTLSTTWCTFIATTYALYHIGPGSASLDAFFAFLMLCAAGRFLVLQPRG